MEQVLINRVAESGIITINLEDYFPKQSMIIFDIKDYLFHGLILKEKDFREALKIHDWTPYQGKICLIQCTADAIIPMWAYMLVATYLQGNAHDLYIGSQEDYLQAHYKQVINEMETSQYSGKRIVIKGCSDKPVPSSAYAYITWALAPVSLSLMFGEPCSTVPVYKKKN